MKLLIKILAVLVAVGILSFGITSFISACTGHINVEIEEDCENITVTADPQDWYDNKVQGNYLTWYKYVAPATGTGTFAWDPILAQTMDFTVTVTFEKWTRANKNSPWVNSGITIQESETETAHRPGSCRWTICHVAGRLEDPANYVTLVLPLPGVLGHFNENGTPLAGHEQDSLGECVVPHCLVTTPVYGEWSDWAVDPVKDPTLATEYRTRMVQNVDFYDNTILCGEPYPETESRTREICVVKEISGYGDWSPWATDPVKDPTLATEYRSRLIYYVDGIDHTSNCGTEVETESRDRPKCQYNQELYYDDPACHEPACTYTTPIYGEWSDWEPYPLDLSQEYSQREVTYLDSVDPTIVCGSNIEYQYRPRELCVVTTISGYGEWSAWMVDPLDPTIEYRTRDIYLVDGIDGTHPCGTDTQKETRPRDRCPYNPELWADDPLCKERCPWNPELFIDDPNCKQTIVVSPCATCDSEEIEQQLKPGDIVLNRYSTCDSTPTACESPTPWYTFWSDVKYQLMTSNGEIQVIEVTNILGQKHYIYTATADELGTYSPSNPTAGGFWFVRDGKVLGKEDVILYNGACGCSSFLGLVNEDEYSITVSGCFKNANLVTDFIVGVWYPKVLNQTMESRLDWLKVYLTVATQWKTGPLPVTIQLPAPAK